jgi:hypothetical protein
MGSNTSKRRPLNRDRRRGSRAPYATNAAHIPPAPSNGWQRFWENRIRKQSQTPENLWLTWGLPAAGVLITFEFMYYAVFADKLGGTSVLGVLGTAACAFAALFARGLHEYVGNRRAVEFPFRVVGTVTGVGAAVAVLIQVVFMS